MKFKIIILIISTILITKTGVQAQDTLESKPVFAVDISAGIGGVTSLAWSASGGVRWLSEPHMLSLQCSYTKEIELHFQVLPFVQDLPRERVSSVSILYGLTHSFHLKKRLFPIIPFMNKIIDADFIISGSVGVSACYNSFRGAALTDPGNAEKEYEHVEKRSVALGIPVQFELVRKFSDKVGYVHRLYYQWNPDRVTWGLQWGVQVYF